MYREELASAVTEPLSLADAKKYARVEHDNDDALVTTFIPTAREYCEKFTKLRYVQHKFKLTYDFGELCNPLKLETRSEISSVDAFDFFDPDDVQTAIAASNFRIQNNKLVLDSDFFNGLSVRQFGSFELSYTVKAPIIKQSVKDAMGMLITHWYENREAILISDENVVNELPAGVKSLLASDKVHHIVM